MKWAEIRRLSSNLNPRSLLRSLSFCLCFAFLSTMLPFSRSYKRLITVHQKKVVPTEAGVKKPKLACGDFFPLVESSMSNVASNFGRCRWHACVPVVGRWIPHITLCAGPTLDSCEFKGEGKWYLFLTARASISSISEAVRGANKILTRVTFKGGDR